METIHFVSGPKPQIRAPAGRHWHAHDPASAHSLGFHRPADCEGLDGARSVATAVSRLVECKLCISNEASATVGRSRTTRRTTAVSSGSSDCLLVIPHPTLGSTLPTHGRARNSGSD